jgi:diguanylate cyclase (GGDEF)-like protein
VPVEERECQAEGGERCLYEVSWEAERAAAAADPQQRVTALEAQLGAISGRLHSVYATASELVSADDLDTALQRIVERAADAVRAPGYVLAIRTGADAEIQVYSHRVDPGEAQAIAERALSGGPAAIPNALVADVTSSRRRYGRLVARYPEAGEFFPQEQEMLNLYATHAAAVLDIATALEEAAQRNAQISSLLDLAHSAAQAGTSEEIGVRLAAAVPQVVDCDRIGVWRWDDEDRCIRFLAAWGHTSDQEARLRKLTVATTDTPLLGSLLENPRPLFFERGTTDAFIERMLETFQMAAMVIVPIVAFDVFLGMITVVVAERPDRLRPDAELLDRLTGVAALAAPAIQNGSLVDELRHQATHDGLTDLLNRAGFRQRMDALLAGERRGDRKVGLLYVDLNGFKEVNDVYGHDAGDELLRQVALRLRSVTRGSDEVARLGGDEFAVVLTHVDEASGTLAAEQRVRAIFDEPFELQGIKLPMSASVGGGVWPRDGDSAEDVVRHADGAMYRDKMSHHGVAGGAAVLLHHAEQHR